MSHFLPVSIAEAADSRPHESILLPGDATTGDTKGATQKGAISMTTEKLTHSGRSTAITHEQQSGISHGRRILDNPWDAQPLAMPPIRPSFADISVTPEQFLSLLDSLDSSVVSRNDVLPVCLSDFDGTLTSGASGSKIFEYGANTDFFLEQVRPEINKTLHFFSMAPHSWASVGSEFLRILAAFRSWSKEPGLDAATKEEGTRTVYKMLSWIYAGHTRAEVHEFAERAFRDIGYEQMHLRGAKEIISALAQKGISTAIISVKFQPILEVAARHFGVPESAVVGMNLELDSAGRFTTQIRPPMTFREGKDEAARSLLASFRKDRSATARPLFAMGDSPAKSDQQMLEMAHVALFAEPQTAHDSEYARELIHQGRRALIVDYESTVEGGPVTLFNRHLETQTGPKGRFL